jgi:hypothetical protein
MDLNSTEVDFCLFSGCGGESWILSSTHSTEDTVGYQKNSRIVSSCQLTYRYTGTHILDPRRPPHTLRTPSHFIIL